MLERQPWMEQLWMPILKEIVLTYESYLKRYSHCSTVLLTTERDFFGEFRQHFIEPAFKSDVLCRDLSGYYFYRNVSNIPQRIIFMQDGLNWLTQKYAEKANRVRSVSYLIDTALKNTKFLILCGYSRVLPTFYEYLKLAYVNKPLPETKELKLPTPT